MVLDRPIRHHPSRTFLEVRQIGWCESKRADSVGANGQNVQDHQNIKAVQITQISKIGQRRKLSGQVFSRHAQNWNRLPKITFHANCILHVHACNFMFVDYGCQISKLRRYLDGRWTLGHHVQEYGQFWLVLGSDVLLFHDHHYGRIWRYLWNHLYRKSFLHLDHVYRSNLLHFG